MSQVLENHYDPDYDPSRAEIEEYGKWLGMTLPEDEPFLWVARSGLKAPLPDHWKACKSEKGELYYFNFRSGLSIWDHPMDNHFKELFKSEKEMKKMQSSSSPTMVVPPQLLEVLPSPHTTTVKEDVEVQDTFHEEDIPSMSIVHPSSFTKKTDLLFQNKPISSSKLDTLKTIKRKKEPPLEVLQSHQPTQQQGLTKGTSPFVLSPAAAIRIPKVCFHTPPAALLTSRAVSSTVKSNVELSETPTQQVLFEVGHVDEHNNKTAAVVLSTKLAVEQKRPSRSEGGGKKRSKSRDAIQSATHFSSVIPSEEPSNSPIECSDVGKQIILQRIAHERSTFEEAESARFLLAKDEFILQIETNFKQVKTQLKEVHHKRIGSYQRELHQELEQESAALKANYAAKLLHFQTDLKKKCTTVVQNGEGVSREIAEMLESAAEQKDFLYKCLCLLDATNRISSLKVQHKVEFEACTKSHQAACDVLRVQHGSELEQLTSFHHEQLEAKKRDFKQELETMETRGRCTLLELWQKQQEVHNMVVDIPMPTIIRASSCSEPITTSSPITDLPIPSILQPIPVPTREVVFSLEVPPHRTLGFPAKMDARIRDEVVDMISSCDEEVVGSLGGGGEMDQNNIPPPPSSLSAAQVRAVVAEVLNEIFRNSASRSIMVPPSSLSRRVGDVIPTQKSHSGLMPQPLLNIPSSLTEQLMMIREEKVRLKGVHEYYATQRSQLEMRRVQLKAAKKNWKRDVLAAKRDGTSSLSKNGAILRNVHKALENQALGLDHDENILRESENWVRAKENRMEKLEETLRTVEQCQQQPNNEVTMRAGVDVSAASIDTTALLHDFYCGRDNTMDDDDVLHEEKKMLMDEKKSIPVIGRSNHNNKKHRASEKEVASCSSLADPLAKVAGLAEAIYRIETKLQRLSCLDPNKGEVLQPHRHHYNHNNNINKMTSKKECVGSVRDIFTDLLLPPSIGTSTSRGCVWEKEERRRARKTSSSRKELGYGEMRNDRDKHVDFVAI